MRLKRLATQSFRNLLPVSLDTDASFVVFSGQNGQGKTNALEAVWYLANLRPLRGFSSSELIAWGEYEAAVAGDVGGHAIKALIGPSRRVFLDGEVVSRVTDYFGVVRAIAFSPDDEEVLRGEPRLRRQWMDRAAFSLQPLHLERVRAYERALEQKRALLRQPDPHWLSVVNEQLAALGAALAEAREEATTQLQPHVERYHAELSGSESRVEVAYRTAARGGNTEARATALHDALEAAREEELRRGVALVGPHRDEVRIGLEGRPARTWASRGQVRSLLLALKLAELQAAKDKGNAPLFLLDDLSSELDAQRTARLVALLIGLETQVFMTTTDAAQIRGLPSSDTLHFSATSGSLKPVS